MSRQRETVTKRTIRRHQLREIVPLADSTIYEMEQRGEFPDASHCRPDVSYGIWRSRGMACRAPIRAHRPARNIPTSGNGASRRSKRRVGL